MEYTNYMGLSDDMFFIEVFKLYDEINRNSLQFLKDRPFIMDRFKNLISNNYVRGDKRRSAHNLIKLYNSYVVLSNVYDVISNPSKYDDDSRVRIFKSYSSFSGDFRGLRLFSNEEKGLIKHVVEGYNVSKKIIEKNKTISQYEAKYSGIVSSLKKILSFYSKHGDSDKFYSILFDDMKVKQNSFNNIVKYTKVFFYQSLCSGKNIIGKDILNDFSLDEIYMLNQIDKNYSKIFDSYKFKASENFSSITDFEKLFKLFDQIGVSLSRRKGVEYTAGYVSNDLRISLHELENYYYSIFKDYCNFKLQDLECDSELKNIIDNRVLKFSDLSNFNSVMTMYKELTHRSIYLCDLLCSDRRNMNNLVNMIYEIKFLNDITPSMNQTCLSSRIRFLSEDNRKIGEKFILGYKEYYNRKKDFLIDSRRQEITDNEVNNIDLYVTNVKLFLDSGCESLDDYFGSDVDDKESFEFSLRVLKKFDHPIYQRYSDFITHISDEKRNRLIGDCREVVRLINEGVLESDGSVREFDLVDFYLYTGLNKQRFMNVIRDNVSSDEYASVSRFFSKYKGERVLEGNMIDDLYLNKVSFPNGWDNDGNVISYYSVTKEDKMNAIITICKMGIPLTTLTYGIVLRDSVQGKINKNNLTKRKKSV